MPERSDIGRCRRRRVEAGELRPSQVLVAFLGAGLSMLAAAAGALVAFSLAGAWWLHWLALHLALLGGVSQLVLGVGQFFVCAFLATRPPSRSMLVAQLAVWNCGTTLVAVGVPARAPALFDSGGALIIMGLLLFAASLRAMQQRSLQRARWAVRWYQSSASCLATGALIGILLAGGIQWRNGSLLGAHLALNLAGWLGTAIVGTLHTFFPSLTGTQLHYARCQGLTFVLWLQGVLAIAVSAIFTVDLLAVVGWLSLAGAAVLLTAQIAASLRARSLPLSLPTRLVASGQGFLLAGVLLALTTCLVHGAAGPLDESTRGPLAALLLAGWIGLTVGGSLIHLLAVLARVRRLSPRLPTPSVGGDRATTVLCVTAAAAWALTSGHGLTALAPMALAMRLLALLAVVVQIMRAALPATRRIIKRAT